MGKSLIVSLGNLDKNSRNEIKIKTSFLILIFELSVIMLYCFIYI